MAKGIGLGTLIVIKREEDRIIAGAEICQHSFRNDSSALLMKVLQVRKELQRRFIW